jgi:hypothetical protein
MQSKPDVASLPAETLAFAHRMFDAARKGDAQSTAILLQAIDAGLPVNLTNDQGAHIDTLFESFGNSFSQETHFLC